jgi:glycosyltransferase involved in cell wall biosynthesis
MQQNKLHIFIAVFFNSPMGGLHLNVLDTVETLLENGHDVTVLSKEGIFSEKIKSLGANSILTNFENIQQSVQKVLNTIEKPIDIIHAHPYKSREVAQKIAQKIQKPFIVTLHSINDSSLSQYVDDVDALIVVSELIKNYIIKQKIIPSEKIFVIPNGVNISKLHQLAKNTTFLPLLNETDNKKILVVSRFDKDKKYLIQSLLYTWEEMLKNHQFQGEWFLAGDGSEIETLKKIALQVNQVSQREMIHFLGWQEIESLTYLYQKTDIFIGPGRTILEAMSFSKPCIALGSKGYIGILNSQNILHGIYTNFGGDLSEESLKIEQLSKDIQLLLKMNTSELQNLEQLSYHTVKSFFSLEKINYKINNLYQLFHVKKPISQIENEQNTFFNHQFVNLKSQNYIHSIMVEPEQTYMITCLLYNQLTNDTDSAFISFHFTQEKITTSEFNKNQFLLSNKQGYHKYLPSKKGFQIFTDEIIIPKGSSTLKLILGVSHAEGKIYIAKNIIIKKSQFFTTLTNEFNHQNQLIQQQKVQLKDKESLLQTETEKISNLYEKIEKLEEMIIKEKHQHQQEIEHIHKKYQKNEENHKIILTKTQKELVRYRDSLSYQLGYILFHFYKSFKNFKSLPKDLYRLFKISKNKKHKKKEFFPLKANQLQLEAKNKEGKVFSELLKEAYFLDPTYKRGISIIELLFSKGFLHAIYEISQDFEKKSYIIQKEDQKKYNEAVGFARLNKNIPSIPQKKQLPKKESSNQKIAMFLHASLPHFSNGYATRSHGILTSLYHFSKYHVEAVTRVGYPWDVKVKGEKSKQDIIDNVTYHHLDGAYISTLPIDKYFKESIVRIESFLNTFQPTIVHSASAYTTALPALIAAKKQGIPFIYEVRGLWEITKSSTIKNWGETERFLLDKTLETFVAHNADHIITLTHGLKEELVQRGINQYKITVIPNSINIQRFNIHDKKIKLAHELKLNPDNIIIGYIGSIVEYEGLDDLLKALQLLKQENIKFQFLLVGDGKYFTTIQKLVKDLTLENEVILTGRIPHNLIEDYYSLIDIAPFPRKPLEVCEIVSPLKPFEAMALEKAVLASDVQALTEIIEDKKTGLLFKKGDILDLKSKLKLLIENQSLREEVGKNARIWVTKERTWEKAVKSFDKVYDTLKNSQVEEKKIYFLVYGDLNLNYIDGSAVWVVSLIELLAGLKHIHIDFLLKAELSHHTLIKPLLDLQNVSIKTPTQYGKEKVLTPQKAVKIIQKLDNENIYDFFILRGFELCTTASKIKRFQSRLWPYLTDIPQSKEALTEEIFQKLSQIIQTADTILCQTKYGKEFLDTNLKYAKKKTILLQPMIPDIKQKHWQYKEKKKIKIVYAGKFAPLWGSREMFHTFQELKRIYPHIELHIFGDKIHNPKDDTTFYEEIKHSLTHMEGVVWYGKVTRQEVLEQMKTMDIAWAWRLPELEMSTHELSTKVLEYGSLGIPTIMMGNAINQNLLGQDYPLFCEEKTLLKTISNALNNKNLLISASNIIFKASQNYTFSSIRKNYLLPLLQTKIVQKYPKTILIAGHDLKFFHALATAFQNNGYQILIDKWTGHNKHNIQNSKALLRQADIIICEWCLGNAVWYTQNKLSHQKLLIRFHRQEIETDYPKKLNFKAIDYMIFVGEHYLKKAVQTFHWSLNEKFQVIGNHTIPDLSTHKVEEAHFHLGIVGIIPKMKRLDKALNILENLRKKDKRFKLFIKGKTYHDFTWMQHRTEEIKYYKELEKRISESELLKDSVFYDGFGDDMKQWYQKIGFVLSTSDFESFHLTVADGAASGSIPIILKWEGSDSIYPKEWSLKNEIEASNKIFKFSKDISLFNEESQKCQHYIQKFSLENITSQWKHLL